MKRTSLLLNLLGGTSLLLVALTGCSQRNPIAPGNNVAPTLSRVHAGSVTSSTEIAGRVVSIDSAARTMTLSGNSAAIIVAANATVVIKSSSSETPITMAQINLNDSAEVRGNLQGGTLTADRVRIRPNDNGANEIEFSGRIVSVDADNGFIRVGSAATYVYVNSSIQILKKSSGTEIPVTLSDLAPADSVDIRGTRQADSSVLANRIRVRISKHSDFDSDLEFKDVITSIDSVAHTFTVAGRTETISTDSLTLFFFNESKMNRQSGSAGQSGGDDVHDESHDSVKVKISLAQFAVGDTVEVYANFVDAATLYAVAVKIEDGAMDDHGTDGVARAEDNPAVKD